MPSENESQDNFLKTLWTVAMWMVEPPVSKKKFLGIMIFPTQNNALNRGQALKDYKI